jgi:hypothetical protein
MGLYINQLRDGRPLPAQNKARFLIENAGATVIDVPKSESDWRANMVCVVENGPFDAAGYAWTPREMMDFAHPTDHRRKTWLIVPDVALIAR